MKLSRNSVLFPLDLQICISALTCSSFLDEILGRFCGCFESSRNNQIGLLLWHVKSSSTELFPKQLNYIYIKCVLPPNPAPSQAHISLEGSPRGGPLPLPSQDSVLLSFKSHKCYFHRRDFSLRFHLNPQQMVSI